MYFITLHCIVLYCIVFYFFIYFIFYKFIYSHGAHPSSSLQLAETFVGIFIGAITFSGSVVAYLKLDAKVSSNAFLIFGKRFGNLRHLLNLFLLVGSLALIIPFMFHTSLIYLYIMTGLSLFLGWHAFATAAKTFVIRLSGATIIFARLWAVVAVNSVASAY